MRRITSAVLTNSSGIFFFSLLPEQNLDLSASPTEYILVRIQTLLVHSGASWEMFAVMTCQWLEHDKKITAVNTALTYCHLLSWYGKLVSVRCQQTQSNIIIRFVSCFCPPGEGKTNIHSPFLLFAANSCLLGLKANSGSKPKQ